MAVRFENIEDYRPDVYEERRKQFAQSNANNEQHNKRNRELKYKQSSMRRLLKRSQSTRMKFIKKNKKSQTIEELQAGLDLLKNKYSNEDEQDVELTYENVKKAEKRLKELYSFTLMEAIENSLDNKEENDDVEEKKKKKKKPTKKRVATKYKKLTINEYFNQQSSMHDIIKNQLTPIAPKDEFHHIMKTYEERHKNVHVFTPTPHKKKRLIKRPNTSMNLTPLEKKIQQRMIAPRRRIVHQPNSPKPIKSLLQRQNTGLTLNIQENTRKTGFKQVSFTPVSTRAPTIQVSPLKRSPSRNLFVSPSSSTVSSTETPTTFPKLKRDKMKGITLPSALAKAERRKEIRLKKYAIAARRKKTPFQLLSNELIHYIFLFCDFLSPSYKYPAFREEFEEKLEQAHKDYYPDVIVSTSDLFIPFLRPIHHFIEDKIVLDSLTKALVPLFFGRREGEYLSFIHYFNCQTYLSGVRVRRQYSTRTDVEFHWSSIPIWGYNCKIVLPKCDIFELQQKVIGKAPFKYVRHLALDITKEYFFDEKRASLKEKSAIVIGQHLMKRVRSLFIDAHFVSPEQMAEIIHRCKNLVHLKLIRLGAENYGVVNLIAQTKQIRSVNLQHVHADMIVKILSNRSIKQVRLSFASVQTGFKYTENGFSREIFYMLCINTSLRYVKIHDKSIQNELLDKLMKHAPHLNHLILYKNQGLIPAFCKVSPNLKTLVIRQEKEFSKADIEEHVKRQQQYFERYNDSHFTDQIQRARYHPSRAALRLHLAQNLKTLVLVNVFGKDFHSLLSLFCNELASYPPPNLTKLGIEDVLTSKDIQALLHGSIPTLQSIAFVSKKLIFEPKKVFHQHLNDALLEYVIQDEVGTDFFLPLEAFPNAVHHEPLKEELLHYHESLEYDFSVEPAVPSTTFRNVNLNFDHRRTQNHPCSQLKSISNLKRLVKSYALRYSKPSSSEFL